MSELPDEVRAAIANGCVLDQFTMVTAHNVLRYLRDEGLILWASQLRDEAVIERAATAIAWASMSGPHGMASAALSAVLDAEER